MSGSAHMLFRRSPAIFVLLFSAGCATGASYYVATNGSDANSGTLANPCASISKGAWMLKPGDTLYIRGGTYYQSVYAPASGTPSAPVTIAGYPGETVVIDGAFTNPVPSWGSLFDVEGSNSIVQDITIKQSNWVGLALTHPRDQALRVNTQSNMENGIIVSGTADYSLVQDCQIYYNAKSNEQFQQLRGGWSTGASAARSPQGVIFRRNRVWNNWGEGLSSYETQNTVFEGNTVYDNKMNVYLSDTAHCIVRSNLIYCTASNVCANASQVGIALGDELYNPPSSDNTIINNLLLGNARNIYYWPGGNGGGLVNVLIAYNTCADATGEADLEFGLGTHTNSTITDNIFLQENAVPVALVANNQGLTFGHNLWSKPPPARAAAPGDIVGNPTLLKSGTVGPGQLTPNWFRITPGSLAIAAAQPLAGVTVDFFGVLRDSRPDNGAIQHVVQPPVNLRILSPQ